MAEDYAAMVPGIIQDIQDTGRPISIIKLSDEPLDTDNPLAGNEDPLQVDNVFATFVYPSGLIQLGMGSQMAALFAESTAIMLVAPDPVHDFSTFNQIVDEGKTWVIDHVEKLKPGTVTLLYYIGVKDG